MILRCKADANSMQSRWKYVSTLNTPRESKKSIVFFANSFLSLYVKEIVVISYKICYWNLFMPQSNEGKMKLPNISGDYSRKRGWHFPVIRWHSRRIPIWASSQGALKGDSKLFQPARMGVWASWLIYMYLPLFHHKRHPSPQFREFFHVHSPLLLINI